MTGGLRGSGLGAGGAPASAHPASALALCCRNSLLEAELAQKGQRLPAARKTGTTIAGVVFKVRGGGGLRAGPGSGQRAGPQRCGPAESRWARARARGWGRTPRCEPPGAEAGLWESSSPCAGWRGPRSRHESDGRNGCG